MSQVSKIGRHATSIYTDDCGFVCVIYHNTAVVKFNYVEIILNTGGWSTVTTKLRMNQTSRQFRLGYNVFQKDFCWYVDYKGAVIPFPGDSLILSRV